MARKWASRSGHRYRCAAIAGLLGTLGASVNARAAGADVCALSTSIAALPYSDSSATTCGLGSEVNNGGPAACSDLPSSYPGPDAFYRIELGTGNSIAINLELASSASGDLAVFLLRLPGCSAADAAAACAGSSIDVIGAGQGPERIKAHSYTPGTYYIVVDSANAVGTSAACGAYSLAVSGSLGTITGGGGTGGGAGTGGSPAGAGGSSGTGGTIAPSGGAGGAAAGSSGVGGTITNAGGSPSSGGAGGSTGVGGQGTSGAQTGGGPAGGQSGSAATGGMSATAGSDDAGGSVNEAGEGGATDPTGQGGAGDAGTNGTAGADAGSGDTAQAGGGGASSPSSGCSCITAGARPSSGGAGGFGQLALVTLGIALARRKRR